MKMKMTLAVAAACMAYFAHAQQTQSNGAVVTGITNDPGVQSQLQVTQRLITQYRAGNVGFFTPSDQWIGIGQPISSGGTFFPVYGVRTQWGAYALNTALREDGGVRNAIIEWGGDPGQDFNINNSEMRFRFFNNNGNPASALNVMGMRPNGTTYFGANTLSSFALVEINGASRNASGINCVTNNSVGSTFTVNNAGTSIPGVSIQVNGSTTTTGTAGILNNVNHFGSFTLPVSFGYDGTTTKATASSSPFTTVGFNDNIGLRSTSVGGFNGVGLWGRAQNSGRANIAVFGEASGGTSADRWGGFFNARVGATGYVTISDARVKKDVNVETATLEKIMKLRPVTYNFDMKNKYFGFSDELQHGFIAQEMAEVFPELVYKISPPNAGKDDQNITYNGINYVALIPVLTKAIQEQEQKIASLERQMAAMMAEKTPANITGTSEINPAAAGYSLQQNLPNPFSGTAIIKYTVPENSGSVTLGVFDLNGKMIQQFTGLRGSAQINISSAGLTPGIYIYSLLSNGQEILSRRMVVTK
jgi:hypothetical protein